MTAEHIIARTSELKVGGHRLRHGDVVKVAGERAATFRILWFTDGTVTAVGGRRGRAPLVRTFTVDRIGVRTQVAGAVA
jgi:hypothetical protein